MTSILTNSYTSQYADSLANAERQRQAYNAPSATTTETPSAAAIVTLSDAAKEKLNGKSFEVVIADAHVHMKELLENSIRSSPLEDGKLAVDLSGLDRRELFAIASNADQQFSADEMKAAALELQQRFDTALAGPLKVVHVTNDFRDIYDSASSYLDAASDEEKATDDWKLQKVAVEDALAQIETNTNRPISVTEDDPVYNYIKRVEAGETGKVLNFADVTNNARAALDRLYKDAGTSRGDIDLSLFDGRSLSAIALNNNDNFSHREVSEANKEVRSRSGKAILAAYQSSRASNDPTTMAKNLISEYGSMSEEERQAAGWTEGFYNTIVSNYQSSAQITQMLSNASSSQGPMSLFDFL